MQIKKRLDHLIVEKFPHLSRSQVQAFIADGLVKINDQLILKPGILVDQESKIDLEIVNPKYVSRAGFKLEKALDTFNIDPKNLVILDSGLSTGGFSDCLLQRGAKKIFGVDVGSDQVHDKIKKDPRMVVMEKTNLKTLKLKEKVDLATLDLSFISLLKVIDAVSKNLKTNGKLITLIKPQFESQPEDINRSGVIKDPKIHQKAVDNVVAGIIAAGFDLEEVIESPIKGSDGNTEFLAYFIKN